MNVMLTTPRRVSTARSRRVIRKAGDTSGGDLARESGVRGRPAAHTAPLLLEAQVAGTEVEQQARVRLPVDVGADGGDVHVLIDGGEGQVFLEDLHEAAEAL